MKIAMIHPSSLSEKGISNYSKDLIENIKKQGEDIEAIQFIQGNPKTLINQISKFKKYDLIHLQHEYNLLGFFGIPYFFFLSILRKKKLIVTMHTVLSKKEKFTGGKIKSFLRKLLYNVQNRWISWNSRKIIVHSKIFKKILHEEYLIPSNKIEVFPHGINENIKTISKVNAKKELKLSGKVYLLIGTMIPNHGHDLIIRQADKIGKTILVATNPHSVNDRNSKKIKDFIELNKKIVNKNNFHKLVRFDFGEISHKKWWKYFAASDLILLPYRGGIGSGIFADAMAMKKPVIANDIPYFRELAKDYGCIKLSKKEDLSKLINNSMITKNYNKMIKECKKYCLKNGLTPISKRYKKLYNSLI